MKERERNHKSERPRNNWKFTLQKKKQLTAKLYI